MKLYIYIYKVICILMSIYIYIYEYRELDHFAICLKITHHCKSTTFQ